MSSTKVIGHGYFLRYLGSISLVWGINSCDPVGSAMIHCSMIIYQAQWGSTPETSHDVLYCVRRNSKLGCRRRPNGERSITLAEFWTTDQTGGGITELNIHVTERTLLSLPGVLSRDFFHETLSGQFHSRLSTSPRM